MRYKTLKTQVDSMELYLGKLTKLQKEYLLEHLKLARLNGYMEGLRYGYKK
jgi:hypothetical protein